MSNILPSLPTYGSAFTSNADRRFDIRTCDIPGIAQPVSIRTDSFLVLLDLDEATALGTRLIAAADHYRKTATGTDPEPDLLHALRVAHSDIQRCPGHTIDMLGRIEAAIARATGDATC